jgi:hypothetical protein
LFSSFVNVAHRNGLTLGANSDCGARTARIIPPNRSIRTGATLPKYDLLSPQPVALAFWLTSNRRKLGFTSAFCENDHGGQNRPVRQTLAISAAS